MDTHTSTVTTTQLFGIDNRTLNGVQREINLLVDKREKSGILSNDYWEYQTMIDVLQRYVHDYVRDTIRLR